MPQTGRNEKREISNVTEFLGHYHINIISIIIIDIVISIIIIINMVITIIMFIIQPGDLKIFRFKNKWQYENVEWQYSDTEWNTSSIFLSKLSQKLGGKFLCLWFIGQSKI